MTTDQRPLIYLPVESIQNTLSSKVYLENIRNSSQDNYTDVSRYNKHQLSFTDIYSNYNNLSEQLMLNNTAFKRTCFLMTLFNLAKPSLHPIPCDQQLLKAVLCERISNIIEKSTKQINQQVQLKAIIFHCSIGTYISTLHICNGNFDCPVVFDDEINCYCILKDSIVKNSSYCVNECHPSNCSCPELYRQNTEGGCEIYSHSKSIMEYTFANNDSFFICSDKSQIHDTLVNDSFPDCPSGEDEPLLLNVINQNRLEYNCPTLNMKECFLGDATCYTKDEKCQYKLGKPTNTLIPCRNGKHLEDCESHQCSKMFKCKSSYCIPYKYKCDSKWDCWNGEDEFNCTENSCINYFKCVYSSICIPLDLFCDISVDCPLGDDEIVCVTCTEGCTCLGFALHCRNVLKVNKISLAAFIFIFVYNTSSFFNIDLEYENTTYLHFPRNNLLSLQKLFHGGRYDNVYVLNVHHNNIKGLTFRRNTVFSQIELLNLSFNVVSNIYKHVSISMKPLKVLDLTSNNLVMITGSMLKGLNSLQLLAISRNMLKFLPYDISLSLNIKNIFAESFLLCCMEKVPVQQKLVCTRTCQNLLANEILSIVLWTICIAILTLGIYSLFNNLMMLRISTKVMRYEIVLINAADITLGLYLIVIATTNSVTKGSFVKYEIIWKESLLCFSLAASNLFAIIISCLGMLLISTTRLLATMYPFGNPLTPERCKKVISIAVCTVVALVTCAIIRISSHDYVPSSLCLLFASEEKNAFLVTVNIFVVCLYVFSLILTATFHISIVRCVVQSSQCVSFPAMSKGKQNIKQLKVYLTIVTSVLFICYIPVVIFLLLSICYRSNGYSIMLHQAMYLIIFPLSALVNPLVLNFFHKLKNAITNIIH